MVRRAQFKTQINIGNEEMAEFMEQTIIKSKVESNNPMVDLPIEKVFAFSRLKLPVTPYHFVFFILWTPIGIPLFFIRICTILSFLIGFHSLGLKDPKSRSYVPWLFVNVIMPFCGLFHRSRGHENLANAKNEKTIFVSNHISNFDPLWFNCILKDFTLLCAGDYDFFWDAMKRIGILSQDDEKGKGCIYTNYFGSAQERENVRIAIEEDMARDDCRPFLIYPEGCVTTGVCAVMQYQKFVFGLDKQIIPMCLSVNNPWPYEHYTISSSAIQNLCWYMFSPWIVMKHAILEPQKIRKSEKAHDFSLRVQCMTAAHLGLSVIKMNWKQKDRLSQALGFAPYNALEWSRRESLDNFREALFTRQLVLRDGHAVNRKDLKDGGKSNLEDNGVFLAKEYAKRKELEGIEEDRLSALEASKSENSEEVEKDLNAPPVEKQLSHREKMEAEKGRSGGASTAKVSPEP